MTAQPLLGSELAFGPVLTAEDRAFQARVRAVCRDVVTPRLLAWEKAAHIEPAAVKALAEAGIFSLVTRGADGWHGWPALALALDEIGKQSASVALLVLAQNALQPLLPAPVAERVAAGAAVVTFADEEERSLGSPSPDQLGTQLIAGGGAVTGSKRNVPFAGIATHAVVTARATGPGVAARLAIIEHGVGGWHVTPTRSAGLRSAGLGTVDFSRAPVIASVSWSEALSVRSAWSGLRTLIEIANGLGAVAFMVKDARRKSSFGKPLLKWQVIQFKLTDGYLKLQMVRVMGHYLASVLDEGRLHTASGLTNEAYVALMRAMYCRLGAEVQEYCAELGSGRAYRVGHPAWRRYMDFVALLLLGGADEAERNLLCRELLGTTRERAS
jgi:alkylation response protein AidB-like acyl-CoA dehydrogenase